MNFKPLVQLALTFLVPFIALLILIPMFLHLELNDTSIGLLLLGALFLMLIINIYKKIGHLGQVWIWLGLALMGISGLLLYSSISINGSEKMIELDAKAQGYCLMIIVAGLVIFALGIKSALSFSYGWGNIKSRR